MTAPVSVLGLGAMGGALAGAFLDGGHPATVWNRTPERAEPLAARGASAASTAAEAIAASPLVVVCLLDYDAVHETLEPAASALAGRTLVNLTNGTPALARQTAEWAAAQDADYIDGGIMAVPRMIGQPTALILYSGAPTAFASHRDTLDRLGPARHLGADAGVASLYDLALLSAMYGMLGGYFHAAALLGSEKIPAAEFTPLVVSWLDAMAASLPRMAEALDAGEHSATESNLRMQATGYPNLLEASRDQGVSTELVEPMKALLDQGVAAGFGDGDISALVELLQRQPAAAG